mmetsp:Transcript_124604/g.311619  ORF Transcript_124604/g.311619 Transcript_124604/m.311619 type:complete len:269 (-) Transcript_124604:616-1422(-)
MIAVMSSCCLKVPLNTNCQLFRTFCASVRVSSAEFFRLTPALIASIMLPNTASASLVNFFTCARPPAAVSSASAACLTRALKMSKARCHSDLFLSHSSCFCSTRPKSCSSVAAVLSSYVMEDLMASSSTRVSFKDFVSLSTLPLAIASCSELMHVVTCEVLWLMKFICCSVFFRSSSRSLLATSSSCLAFSVASRASLTFSSSRALLSSARLASARAAAARIVAASASPSALATRLFISSTSSAALTNRNSKKPLRSWRRRQQHHAVR